MTDTTDPYLGRRAVLKRSAAGAFGLAGWGVRERQDDGAQNRYTRRMAFEEPDRLSDDWRQRPLLLTDRTDEDPDVSEVADCAFGDWPTENLTIWEGIVVDVKNIEDVRRFLGASPTVRAEKLVERDRMYLDERDTPVQLGTPFVVDGVVECPGAYLGVTATQIPGLRIKTGSGVSTEDE